MSETTTPAEAPTEATTAATPAAAETLFGATTPTPPVAEVVPPVAEAVVEAKTEEPAKAEVVPEKAAVPEKYEFKAPEGVEIDPAALAEFSPIAKELGLSQEQAQKLVDLQIKQTLASREAQATQYKAYVEKLAGDARADKEIGGSKFDENISFARKAIDKFGTTELKSALDEPGMGNHPEIVRFLVRVGKAMAEDGFVSGSSGGGTQKTAAERLFGNTSG